MSDRLSLGLNPMFHLYTGSVFTSGILLQEFSQAELQFSVRYSLSH
jgi:hypothetical protein